MHPKLPDLLGIMPQRQQAQAEQHGENRLRRAVSEEFEQPGIEIDAEEEMRPNPHNIASSCFSPNQISRYGKPGRIISSSGTT